MRTTTIAMMALLALALCSCDYKDLCYDHTHEVTINVVYDWENAPEAYPEGMCIFFYNAEDGSFYDRWDFYATKAADSHVLGGQVKLPSGTYKVITYNNDTEAVLFSGTNGFDTHLAYTREGDVFEPVYGNTTGMSGLGSRADDDSDERVVIAPDMIWGAWATYVEINSDSISYVTERKEAQTEAIDDTDLTITLYPQELVCTYTYEVRHVINVQYATIMSGTLSALAPSEYLGTWELGDELVTVPFSGSISMDDAVITGGFYTFGNNEDNSETHLMTLYVWLTNGEKYYYTYDVTDQVDGAPDPKHVHIVIDEMELPVAISNGEGFHPSVDEWQSEDYEIVL